VAGWVQVAQSGAPADAIRIIDRARSYSGSIGSVVIRAFTKPGGAAGLVKSLLIRIEFLRFEPPNCDGPIGAPLLLLLLVE